MMSNEQRINELEAQIREIESEYAQDKQKYGSHSRQCFEVGQQIDRLRKEINSLK